MPVYSLIKYGKFSTISLYNLFFWDTITHMLDILTFVLEIFFFLVLFFAVPHFGFFIASDLLILCCKVYFSSLEVPFTNFLHLHFPRRVYVFLYFLTHTEFIITSFRFLSIGCIIFVVLGFLLIDFPHGYVFCFSSWFCHWMLDFAYFTLLSARSCILFTCVGLGQNIITEICVR